AGRRHELGHERRKDAGLQNDMHGARTNAGLNSEATIVRSEGVRLAVALEGEVSQPKHLLRAGGETAVALEEFDHAGGEEVVEGGLRYMAAVLRAQVDAGHRVSPVRTV